MLPTERWSAHGTQGQAAEPRAVERSAAAGHVIIPAEKHSMATANEGDPTESTMHDEDDNLAEELRKGATLLTHFARKGDFETVERAWPLLGPHSRFAHI